MKLPFTIEGVYTTDFSVEDITRELEKPESKKYFGGLRVDKHEFKADHSSFNVQRYSNGISALQECYPLITGEIVNEDPTRIFLTLKPHYFTIIFFALFAIAFAFAGIFTNDWTINGVKRSPTIVERLFIVLIGGGIPFTLCFFQHIRPIKKTERWIVKKLNLSKLA